MDLVDPATGQATSQRPELGCPGRGSVVRGGSRGVRELVRPAGLLDYTQVKHVML